MNFLLIMIGIFSVLGVATAGAAIVTDVNFNYPNWQKFDTLFRKFATKYAVDWKDLKAIGMIESRLGSDKLTSKGLVSSDGLSYGLMQVTLTTAGDLRKGTTADDLNNPEISIELAARYISQLNRRYQGDKRKMIMSYNQGPGNTDKGKEYAAGYYSKWVVARASVEEHQ